VKQIATYLLLFVLGTWAPGAFAADTAADAEPPLRFEGYPAAPDFSVAPPTRRSKLPRCIRCHGEMEPNPTIRRLADAPHVDGVSHGSGRVWCLVCHDQDERNYLRTLAGDRIEGDQAYLLCGACHAAQQKDWYFGGHGKRLDNWHGERVIHNCTSCHDPHDPAIEPREPKAAPEVRLGLQRVEPEVPAHGPDWLRAAEAHATGAGHE
jgi:cytochrome c553